MRILQSSFFRSLCAIVVGILLIEYREETVRWITILIGVMFFISGVISVVTYLATRHKPATTVYDSAGREVASYRPMFPVVGLGSIILGGLLALMPTTFVTGLTVVLALIVALGAISQMMSLTLIRRLGPVSPLYWVMPSLTLLAALLALIWPEAVATAPLLFIGCVMVVYGVTECANAIKIYRQRRTYASETAQTGETAEAQAGEEAQS